jgi:hypothetical protein
MGTDSLAQLRLLVARAERQWPDLNTFGRDIMSKAVFAYYRACCREGHRTEALEALATLPILGKIAEAAECGEP